MRQFTEWLNPEVMDDTHYGLISNSEWIRNEVDRLGEKFFRRTSNGRESIWTTLPSHECNTTKDDMLSLKLKKEGLR